ncbi:MAG TPA: SPFH domain-containing protein [Candidatus Limnocylindria bacterium]|nr:SPFH domain-containing protein [Candidatus Limnocylindria bacterium]
MADEPLAAVPPPYESQLTQVKVPIADAADAFSIPDASGRFPIVVLTGERSRIRNDFVVVGIGLLAIGIIVNMGIAARGGLIVAAAAVIFLGVVRSFIIRVPEGAQALTLRAGRFDRVLAAGNHVLPPWIAVTHVVTKREIPFTTSVTQVPTGDGVRIDVGLLITFSIDAADRFVFAISAPDFDLVCSAASQDALRQLVRGIASEAVLDLAGAESDALRDVLGRALDDYGVKVHKVVIVSVHPPNDYMASLEARRLATVQQAEQAERHALERRRQADRIDLERQRAEEERKLIEIEAANESLRLERLQERLAAYPQAARWDFDGQRLDIARALAGNERALLAVGDPAKLTEAMLVADRGADLPMPAPKAGAAPARGTPRGRRGTNAR